MKLIETSLPGCVAIEPAVFGDARGFFMETWNAARFGEHPGLPTRFVQSNVSSSSRGVLREDLQQQDFARFVRAEHAKYGQLLQSSGMRGTASNS